MIEIAKPHAPQLRKSFHLLYHQLCAVPTEYLYAVSKNQFEAQLDCMTALGTQANCLVPQITFDDGYMSDYEYALPALQAREMQATFFITAGWTGRMAGYMDWAEIRAIHAAGQQIGAHGWSHKLLTHCDDSTLHDELTRSKAVLEDKLGTAVDSMSLPGGRSNRRVMQACWNAGYAHVYTSEPRAEPIPAGAVIGRMNIRADMKLEWIASLFQQHSPARAAVIRRYKQKQMAKSILGDTLYEKLWNVLNRKDQEVSHSESIPK